MANKMESHATARSGRTGGPIRRRVRSNTCGRRSGPLSNHAAETGPAACGVTGRLAGLSDDSASGNVALSDDSSCRLSLRQRFPDRFSPWHYSQLSLNQTRSWLITESIHSYRDPRSFLEDLRLAARPRRHLPPCSVAVAFLGATRSPRSIFWEAPDDGRESNCLNRRAYSIQFIQINIRPARWPEELLILGRRRRPPIELDTGFGGPNCVGVLQTTIWSSTRQRTRPGSPKSS